MRGNKIGEHDFGDRTKESNSIYGLTVGGPIVKNKLFFFGNLEFEKTPQQVIRWRASQNGVSDHQTISRVTEEDLQTVSDYLRDKYGYETGSFKSFPADESNLKYLARIDWNITDAHKLSVRYNHTKNTAWNAPNGNSTDGSYRDKNKNRVGEFSFSFANSMYSQDNVVNSGSLELNSRFSNSISNQLLVTYSDIQDVRGSTSSPFPFIDIMSGDIADGAAALDPYMSAGYELFTWNNGVKNKVITATDNFTYYLNAHKLTAGVSFEYQMADNNYMRSGTGYYRYYSLSDFLNGAAPVDFALTYGTNGNLVPSNAVNSTRSEPISRMNGARFRTSNLPSDYARIIFRLLTTSLQTTPSRNSTSAEGTSIPENGPNQESICRPALDLHGTLIQINRSCCAEDQVSSPAVCRWCSLPTCHPMPV